MNKNCYLIAGLGNPSTEYQRTYHNLGFWVLDKFLKNTFKESSFSFDKKSNSEICVVSLEKNGKKLIFIKPQTFMNNSGLAISKVKQYYKIPLENILVIHDEFDLEVGNFKLSTGSGSAGHNGVKSIISQLGEKNFSRLRIGIRRAKPSAKSSHLVLKKISADDEEKFNLLLPEIFVVIEDFYQT